jgi:hypothetical protein
LCFDDKETLSFKNFYASFSNKHFEVTIDFCNQTILERTFPGEGRKCRSQTEAKKLMPQIFVSLLEMQTYFD